MNAMQQELYARMQQERVNVEIMFTRDNEQDPIISCRLREWSAGRNAGRMILAGGRTLDEALAYAYTGLCENEWIPVDWRARAVGVGVVHTLAPTPLPVRQPINLRDLLEADNTWDMIDVSSPAPNGPQNGAHKQPRRKDSE